MNQIRKLEVILDADDVLIECNSYALSLLKLSCTDNDLRSSLSIDHITDWGLLGIPEDERLSFLNDASFYRNQPAMPGAAEFLRELSEYANVTIMTAVYPQFMGDRIQRLMQLFPGFPMENIIMGKRKEMLQADVMLDDGLHNLLSSDVKLPVLYRRPWNRKASGLCSVNHYNAFLSLIRILTDSDLKIPCAPYVFCIVGPSGSGKHAFADALCQDSFCKRIRTYTTADPGSGKNNHLSEQDFNHLKEEGAFLETTYYCGEQYALPLFSIDQAIENNQHVAAVMDISGCMSVLEHYPGRAKILYVDSDKRQCVSSILAKQLEQEHMVDRILSIDLEQKNKVLADHIICPNVDGSFDDAVRFIKTRYCGGSDGSTE